MNKLMNKPFAQVISFVLIMVMVSSPIWATCGGGGGGGGGGMANSGPSGGSDPTVYHVPWKAPLSENQRPTAEGIILYWFPASIDELKRSSLRESRGLSLYAGQCVSMYLADARTPDATKLVGESKPPVAVLANPDGTTISKVGNKNGKLNVADVEKLVGGEIKTRESAVDTSLKDAKAKAAAGDNAAAIKIYQTIAAEKCMFPKKAKEAASALKKLGAENIGEYLDIPNFDPSVTETMLRIMKKGLVAENEGKYTLADQFYSRAHAIDPADPTPLRYMGELYRPTLATG
jgi:hypothetical protein